MSNAAHEDGISRDRAGSVSEGQPYSARREHAFQSLLELARELRISLDVYETADLLLLSLMGQLMAARSALWLVPEDGARRPAMVRCHGFNRPLADAIGAACAPGLRKRFDEGATSVLAWSLREFLKPADFELVRQADIALFVPLHSHTEIQGWLALGSRVDGSAYGPEDFEVLQAAVGMVGVSLENTRLHNRALENNRRLRAANDRLQELDRLKNEFLSNVNHELRTPLAVVIATLECLEQGKVEGPMRGLLESAHTNSLHLKGLIETLLTFSDARNARLPIHLVLQSVEPTVRRYFVERQPGISASLREFLFEPGEVPLEARFDEQRLFDLLDELLDNAVKFTLPGARLTLRVRPWVEDEKEWVRIDLCDDGPGIPANQLASLFDLFVQVDGSSTRRVGGLGMGLTLASELAERMGGRLKVESALGRGSTFATLLPRS